MTIDAKIIRDSISSEGIRLTTFQLRYPRFIHAELMTHRVFSRNASSSRAIPVQRMIEDLRRDPAMPVFWGSHQAGMQAGEELKCSERVEVERLWIEGMENAIRVAQEMMNAGLHKQIANRILEPWAHINVVVTATDWDNFYELRRHADAQPEIKVLADAMWVAHKIGSLPERLLPGEWHLPYITVDDYTAAREFLQKGRVTRDVPQYPEIVAKVLIPVSVARCARVSYLTHDGKATTIEQDMALYDRLVGSVPLHASPAEHQATPDMPNERAKMMAMYGGWAISDTEWENRSEWGNFRGWRQFRKQLEAQFYKKESAL